MATTTTTTKETRPAIGAAQPKRDERTATVAGLLGDEQFMLARLREVATKHLPPERAVRLAIGAVRRTPRLAECDATSFFGSLMSATGFGLEPNTPAGLAFLIPFKKRVKQGNNWVDAYECQFQIGYKGFVELMYRQTDVADLTAECIHEGDLFEHEKGNNSFLRYRKMLAGNRGDAIGAFAFVSLRDGHSFTVLPIEEILKIRARSQTWTTLARAVEMAESERDKAKALAKLQETPWEMWFDDMAAKSAIKKQAKQMRIAPDLAAAAALDSALDAGASIRAMADPAFAKAMLSGDEDLGGDGEGGGDEEDDQSQGRPQITKSTEQTVDQQGAAAAQQQRQAETVETKPAATTAAAAKAADPQQGQKAAAPSTARRARGSGLF